MIAASFLMLVLASDGAIGQIDGCILFGGLLGYVARSVRLGRSESQKVVSKITAKTAVLAKPTASRIVWRCDLILVGLGLLTIGSRWLVGGAADVTPLTSP